MPIAQWILDRMTSRRLREIERAVRNPEATQARALERLLERGRRTEWGRRHGFSELRDVASYTASTELTTYEEMKPWWERSFTGDRDVTWPGHIRYFALSSGTTSGNKLLPISKENIRSNQRSGASVLALFLQQTGDTTFTRGKSLYLAGSAPLRPEGRSRIGDASGIMLQFTPRLARRYRLPSVEVSSMTAWNEKIRRVVSESIDEDVRLVSACPSWGVLLLEEVIRASRERGRSIDSVREVWPRLSGLVHFGMAWQPYREAFDRLMGAEVVHLETYSASEGGMFSVTDARGRDDMLLLIDNGIFYEFVPEDRIAQDQPPRVPLAGVEKGKTYEVVLTTNSGLWSYRLGDLVRFTSTSPPRIRMVGRSRMNLNAFGEHVIVEEMEEAVACACRESGAELTEFTVCPIYPEGRFDKPYHRWLIEFRKPPSDLEAFSLFVDRTIRDRNEDYDTHRSDDYGLAPPRVEVLQSGTFYRWMERQGKLGGQHKVPRVLTEPRRSDELVALSQ